METSARNDNAVIDNGEVPEGWTLTSIGAIFDLNPRKASADALPAKATVTFVPMPAVDAEVGAITAPQERAFAAVRKGYTSFIENDVIVAKITPCMENGKAAIARDLLSGHGFGSSEFHVLRPTGTALPEYAFHFVRQQSFRRDAAENMTGSVGQKRVPAEYIENAELPVPPLAEQKRIVAKVEALLERVNSARARLARVPAILKRFRRAVLAAACSGRLTKDWREEHPDAESRDKLLERIAAEVAQLVKDKKIRQPQPLLTLQQDDVPYEMPISWKWIRLQGACDPSGVITYGILKPVWVADGVPTVRVKDIQGGQIIVEDVVKCSYERAAKFSKTTLKAGDLLIAKDGATLGKTAFVPKSLDGGNVTQHVLRFPISRHLCAQFVRLVIDSPIGQSWMTGETKGVALPGVNVGDFRQMPLPLPPIVEQHEIVRRVEALFKLADGIEARVAAAARRAEKVTPAILAKAFRGELVPTEAELARREGRAYEPATELLARIRAERNSILQAPREAARNGKRAPDNKGRARQSKRR